jgi:hypothetical protein
MSTSEGIGRVFPYATSASFNTAITARLKIVAAESPYTVSQLRRQFAYDRFLARVFTLGDQSWILKGGVAMLARLAVARHSMDIDLAADFDATHAALHQLRLIADHDLHDHFTFVLAEPRSLVKGIAGVRVPVTAQLGPRMFERFSVDLVTGAQITAAPEVAHPLDLLGDLPGLVRPDYRLYPLVDTLADKVLAVMEQHGERPSTRFRDLVDIMLILRTSTIDAAALRRALASEHRRRGRSVTVSFAVPDESLWRAGYARTVVDAPNVVERTLDQALPLAKAFLDPILEGAITYGSWNPATRTWELDDELARPAQSADMRE